MQDGAAEDHPALSGDAHALPEARNGGPRYSIFRPQGRSLVIA